jgi:hypothetical protein
MSVPKLEPIRDDDLLPFCTFLNKHLNPRIQPQDWVQAFRQRWDDDKPNNGFLLRDGDRIVGGIGAIYSKQNIRGKAERFCNITSWCVLEPYRSQSMRMALTLTAQPGYHYTDLTPTKIVAGSLRFLKFRPMNEKRTVWPNPPSFFRGDVRVLTDPEAIGTSLPAEASRVYRDHRHLPWLSHFAVGRTGAYCHIVFKRGVLKKLPCADVLYISDPGLYLRYHRQIGHYLLSRHGMPTCRAESRLLTGTPPLAREVGGYIPKMFRSDTLTESDISNLYSELAALDL